MRKSRFFSSSCPLFFFPLPILPSFFFLFSLRGGGSKGGMSPRQGLVRGTLTYLRRDLREIVAPTSLPDDKGKERGGGDGGGIAGDSSHSFPSSSSPSRRFTGRLRAVASGVSDYCDSWKKPVEAASGAAAEAAPEEPEDAALREAAGDARDALASASRQAASVAAAAAAATVSGSEALRPALRHLYRTRAAAYRDAVFSFVEGYREGVSGAAAVGEGGEEDDDDADDDKDERERGSKARTPNKETTTTTPPPPRDDEKK